MSATDFTRNTGPRTLETYCPLDGHVTAELRGGEEGAFVCPTCGMEIPRRIVELGPNPGELDGDSDV